MKVPLLWNKEGGLDTQLNKPTNQNLIKVPKVFKPTNTKMYYKTLGIRVINSLMPPGT